MSGAPRDNGALRLRLAGSLNGAFRRAILAAAVNPAVRRVVERYGMHLGAARFVAGETLDDALAVLIRLDAHGFHTNTTLLGEGVEDRAAAAGAVDAYREVLDRIAAAGLRTNLALKLTHLGLGLDPALARRNLDALLEHAAARGNFIRIDMEESACVEETLAIYRRARAEGPDNVGAVLQAYLHRTPADLEALLPLRPNLRLVKGAYREPAGVALQRKADVDRAYLALIERSLAGGAYTCVATHDERAIDHARGFAGRAGIGRERFEFQMLYGVRPALQRRLLADGYKVLVAVPFGREWYPYLTRRLAERPANLAFFLRNAVRR
jgi:proline dehydrogenase